MKDNIHLIIPMSGIGKRFLDAGYTDPKPLIEVDGYPMIKHVIDLFPGVPKVTFICNENHLKYTNIKETLKSLSPNANIYSVPNDNRLGPVDAVLKIKDFIHDTEEVIVSYCDYGTVWDFDSFLEKIREQKLDGCISCYTGFHPHMLGLDNYAYCKVENDTVSQVKEKEPFTSNKMDEFSSNGTYYFKSGKILKKYFEELINFNFNVNGEFYVSLVYNLLIKDGLKVGYFEIDKMLQWGTPHDLEIYKGWLRYFNSRVEKSKKIKCPDDTTLILPMAGKGSRFYELGFTTPKPLLLIDENPMIIEAVNCLPDTNKKTFVCLKEHNKENIINSILENRFKDCKIIQIDSVTEGQAITCEIGINSSKLNEDNPILISACDNGILYDENKLNELFNDENIDIIVFSFRNNQSSNLNPNAYAWLDVDELDNIKNVSCKKFIGKNPLETHAIVGTMFFRKAKYFLDGLRKNRIQNIKTNKEYYVDDVLNQNIKDGLNVKIFEVNHYTCWGTPNDYLTYNYWKEFFT